MCFCFKTSILVGVMDSRTVGQCRFRGWPRVSIWKTMGWISSRVNTTPIIPWLETEPQDLGKRLEFKCDFWSYHPFTLIKMVLTPPLIQDGWSVRQDGRPVCQSHGKPSLPISLSSSEERTPSQQRVHCWDLWAKHDFEIQVQVFSSPAAPLLHISEPRR